MNLSRFTMLSWPRPAGVRAAGKFVLQTRRPGTRTDPPTVQTHGSQPQRSRPAAPVRAISKAAGFSGSARGQMDWLRSSDALGFHEQQHDAAHERERSDRRRDEMTGGGFKVHPQKVHRFARRRESKSRIGEHHNAQRNEQDGNDSFRVHNESINY